METEKSLRIIHCFRSPIGGIFRHVRDLVIEHAEAGHKVGILCDNLTGGEFEEKLFDEIRPFLELGLIRMPIRRAPTPKDFGAFWRSYKEIRSLQPDVLHGHGAKGGAIARLIGSVLRVNRYCVARLYSPHGGSLHFHPFSPPGLAVLSLERLLGHATDATVFVCDYEKRTYLQKIGTPKNPVVVYNGVREHEFEKVQTEDNAADFLFIGMMRDLKGPDLYIKAFVEAERMVGRPLSALLVGDGPGEESYKQLKSRLGVERRISMHPAMKPRIAFAKARTIVVPSRAEAMPYIVLEAVAAGRPVIASRVGGIPEMLGENNPALVKPGDWQTLGAVMAQSVTNARWKDQVIPEEESFKQRFSAKTMSKDILATYRKILAGKPA